MSDLAVSPRPSPAQMIAQRRPGRGPAGHTPYSWREIVMGRQPTMPDQQARGITATLRPVAGAGAHVASARRAGLADRLAERLLDEIVAGVYPAGTRLPPEPVLAERAGVSRLTLREA